MAQESISRTVFQFTVMHPTDMVLPDLASAMAEADTGNAVGDERVIYTNVVRPSSVGHYLRQLGNDGTFFDSDDDEDD